MTLAAKRLKAQVFELIRRTSTTLPPDVLAALERSRSEEEEGSLACRTFALMLENATSARDSGTPLCQDTGTLAFLVDHGPDRAPIEVERAIVDAVRLATAKSYLRPNAIDPLTGSASADNVGAGAPDVQFRPQRRPGLRIRLLMKGGGSENVSAQYALPDSALGAGRDLDGVRRCVIDAVQKAQGYGCAPGTVGVGVGGDRATSHLEAREQLFRALDDANPDPTLDALERDLTRSLNDLKIGPMGFGGRTTVLGVKIGARARVPTSFFVAVSYMCWAYRRGELLVKGTRATLNGDPLAPPASPRKRRGAPGRPSAPRPRPSRRRVAARSR